MKFLSFALILFTASVTAADLSHLLPSERNNVEIYQQAESKVVYVHRYSTERAQVANGAGSGILWDKNGYVITNYHVIHGAKKIAVTINKQKVSAKVIGVDPKKDVAVLRVNPADLKDFFANFKPFEIVKTSDLLVGQKTIAIGNPFGLDHSLTTGVVSALGRQFPSWEDVKIREAIQTDAAINPGNSGGPLLDSSGRLMGMNTLIFSQSGTSSGVGFAVPADEIQRVVTQIIKYGRVQLAGIGIQRVDENIARHLGVKKGILVGSIMTGTPAKKVGLKGTYQDSYGQIHLGDIIVGLNGQAVANYDDLYNLLAKISIGSTIELAVNRRGEKKTFKMQTIDISGH